MEVTTISRFTKYTRNISPDYSLLTAPSMDELLFSGFDQALGEKTRERIRQQFENYEYYEGKQHKDQNGNLVKGEELPRPADLDYDPTRYATNYFKAIVDRKARWQMGGKHGIKVPRKQIDDINVKTQQNYQPSDQQRIANDKSEAYEKLLYQLWQENKMRSKLIKAARDRLIANKVVCKIAYNPRNGKLRWVWRPDPEFIPIYSEDDFEELIACHFVKMRPYETNSGEIDAVQKQTFRLIEGECYVEEAIYRVSDLALLETITSLAPMGIDFIPVVEFPVDELLTEGLNASEVGNLREQNDVLNQLNEDAIDSMKFEMFPMTVLINAPDGTASKMSIAPGAAVEIRGVNEGQQTDLKKVESGFKWKEAFKDQYARVKGAMHEISGLPQIVPQELNFGGLNGEALQVLFHDIITNTEEHWLTWGYGLSELHEKSIRYLQARVNDPRFSYDKRKVRMIDDYTNEMQFVLPLPDNRKELVELLTIETAGGFESKSGAIERLGVEDVQEKIREIQTETERRVIETDPYAEEGG